jgi:DNA-binding transcriptional MerR regulator/methylmalonyl-CoA mutase cobalamin-binding subunit
LSRGVYTVKVAAERAGVTPELLRAWERRYGVPSPARGPSGYRLYSEEDIRTVRWIREQTESGLSVRQAVELFRGNRSGLEGEHELDAVRITLLDLLLARELAKAKALLERVILGRGIEVVCVEALQPLLARVGEMWHRGEITTAHEHWVSQTLKSVLIRRLVEERERPRDGVRVVVACAPEELHEIGALMLALFLSHRRLDVLYLGQAVPLADLHSFVGESEVEAVFLSVAQEQRAEQMLAGLPEFESANGTRVFVGGLAFESEALRKVAGERFLAPDAQEAADAAAKLLQK